MRDRTIPPLVETTNAKPDIQHVYGPSTASGSAFFYFGTPYPAGTKFYDNVDGFFQNAMTQKHNLVFSGASPDSRVTYRLSGGSTRQQGVIRNSQFNRLNLTGSSSATVTSWLNADLVMQYAYDNNDQPLKGDGGPLLGLLVWPDTNNAKDWLNASGTRQRFGRHATVRFRIRRTATGIKKATGEEIPMQTELAPERHAGG